MAELGLPHDRIGYGNFQRADAYEATKRLLANYPDTDAIFACSDIMAQGVYEALNELGRRIPDDVAVVGFDDLPTAVLLKPSLTTVRQPLREKGASATEILLNQIEGKTSTEARHVVLPASLIVRDLSGPNCPPRHDFL